MGDSARAAVWREVETWNRKKIATVLARAAEDAELSAALEDRYGKLLVLAEVDVKDLAKVPAKLKTKKAIVTRWEPDETSSAILATIPIKAMVFRTFRKIKSLPNWVGHLARLESLDLDRCYIDGCPDSMGGMRALETLRLIYNPKLTELPDGLGELEHLAEIDLSECRLTALPPVARWVRLKVLRLDRNNFTALPRGVCGLPQLEELSLGWNPLTELPADIGALQSLRVLQLRGCARLEALPPALLELDKLDFVDVTNTALGAKMNIEGPVQGVREVKAFVEAALVLSEPRAGRTLR